MHVKKDSNILPEEECLTIGESASKIEIVKGKSRAKLSFRFQDKKVENTEDDNQDLKEVKHIPVNSQNVIDIPIWKKKKIRIYKALIPVRIAQIFWFGGGRLNMHYFSLIMKQRGLTVIEFSSVYSLIFLFQFLVSSTCGIVADKLGNVKPVLMFTMSVSLITLICILCAPNLRDKSCNSKNVDQVCLDILKNNTMLDNCKDHCLENETKNFLSNENEYSNETAHFKYTFEVDSVGDDFDDLSRLNVTNTECNVNCSCVNYYQSGCSHPPSTGLRLFYIVVILAFFSFKTPSYRFLDFTVLNMVEENKSHFGKERSFAILGEIAITSLGTLFLSFNIFSDTKSNYDSTYLLSSTCLFLSIISVYKVRSKILPPGRKLARKSLELLMDIKLIMFLIVVFIAGNAYSFSQAFNLWYLDTLKPSKLIIGIHSMTHPVYGFSILYTSKWWIKKLGTERIFILGLLLYTVNLTGYSFIYNPWIPLLLQITEPFTFHLFWVSAAIHAHKIAPEGFAATVNVVAGAMHFGFGRSSGVSLGGLLMNYYGARVTYRIVASICFSTAILYFLFLLGRQYCCLKKKISRNEEEREMEKMTEIKDEHIQNAAVHS